MQEVVSSPAEQDRADVYGLLAALLLGPDAALIEALAALPCGAGEDEGDDPLAAAWDNLVQAARAGPVAVREEFDSLFVAAGTPRLNPYQCWYLAGCLMDQPLLLLRQDLQRIGLARARGATELEDHLGALCETMRLLIELGRPLAAQQAFFQRHLAGWSGECLADIANAPGSRFYRALAGLALAFFEQESDHVAATA